MLTLITLIIAIMWHVAERAIVVFCFYSLDKCGTFSRVCFVHDKHNTAGSVRDRRVKNLAGTHYRKFTDSVCRGRVCLEL